MATDSILPLTIDHSSLRNGSSNVDPLFDLDSILLSADLQTTDSFLSDLLASDDDFLKEFLNPTTLNPVLSASSINTLPPSPTTTLTTPYLPTAAAPSHSSPYHDYQLCSSSTGGESSNSPVSSVDLYSPWSGGGGVAINHSSPISSSPLDERNMLYSEFEAPPLSSDVHIDVDMNEEEEEEEERSSSAERKTGLLVLSEEEKKLLVEEGVYLPTDMPLTKAEERKLKKVRRKIKNKFSAAESRKRKRVYVDGLEKRVEMCTAENFTFKKKIGTLQTENKSLLSQLHKLQAIVGQYSPSKIQAGSFLMVLMLSFSIFVFPSLLSPQSDVVSTGTSRTLLNVNTDDFGNIVDPITGKVISDTTPLPLPPWKYQSPLMKTYHRSSPPPPPLSRNLPDL